MAAGELLVDQDKYAARLRSAKGLLTDSTVQAVAELTAALFLRPNEPEPYRLRGEALAGMCDFHSAVINFRKALQLTPSTAPERVRAYSAWPCAHTPLSADRPPPVLWQPGTMQRLAALLDLLALSKMDEGAYARAIELLTEAIGLSPSTASLSLHRALAHTGTDAYEPALRDLGTCIAVGGASADVHFLRAKLLLLRKALPEAREAVDAALILEPRHAQAAELRTAMTECAAVYTEESVAAR